MKRAIQCCLILLTLNIGAMAQMTHEDDEASIKKMLASQEAAWDGGDGPGFAAPFTEDAESSTIFNTLEQVQLADKLGFDQVWSVEHHFLEEYSHSSAPDVFLTACAMTTERIHLCHGIVVCVPEFNSLLRTPSNSKAIIHT